MSVSAGRMHPAEQGAVVDHHPPMRPQRNRMVRNLKPIFVTRRGTTGRLGRSKSLSLCSAIHLTQHNIGLIRKFGIQTGKDHRGAPAAQLDVILDWEGRIGVAGGNGGLE